VVVLKKIFQRSLAAKTVRMTLKILRRLSSHKQKKLLRALMMAKTLLLQSRCPKKLQKLQPEHSETKQKRRKNTTATVTEAAAETAGGLLLSDLAVIAMNVIDGDVAIAGAVGTRGQLLAVKLSCTWAVASLPQL
jgi:hypothetical protein